MRKREEDYPQEKPSFQRVGILMLLLLVIMMFWFLDGYFFGNEEQEIDCDPEHEDCDKLKIIVRFIGNYKQLITNT